MNKIIFIVGIFAFTACSILTEPDLTKSPVQLIAPVNNLVTTTNVQTFWWDYVPDAVKYNLLIISPDWDSVVSLVVDTNLSVNKFTMSFEPGEYDWGVSAYNNSSSTKYFISHFKIDTTSSLTGKKVVLKSPVDNYASANTTFSFKWDPMTKATVYLFDIKQNDWENGDNYISTEYLTSNTFSCEITDDGTYYWNVKAQNNNSFSSYGTSRKFFLDRKKPLKLKFNNPLLNGDTLTSDNLNIEWERTDETGSPITDSIVVASDSLFANFIKIDDVAVGTSYPVNNLDKNKFYFCKIWSKDAAGNSGPSVLRKFYIE